MTKPSTTHEVSKDILLVHGAWQGAWAWDDVRDLFAERGIRIHTLDLPGSGQDATPVTEITLQSYSDAIIEKARSIGPRPIVLLGHSMGGAAITAAATQAPELFERLVYVCAFLPRPGDSVASLGAEAYAMRGVGPQASISDNVSVLEQDSIESTFLHDCDAETVSRVRPMFRPQPVAPILQQATWSDGFEALTKAYLVCTEDRAIDPELQVLMAERGRITNIRKLDSGHEPFFAMPSNFVDEVLKLI